VDLSFLVGMCAARPVRTDTTFIKRVEQENTRSLGRDTGYSWRPQEDVIASGAASSASAGPFRSSSVLTA
jgi:hypothetical protein